VFQERLARRLSFIYSSLLYQKDSNRIRTLIKKETMSRWKILEKQPLCKKSYIVRFLFLKFPYLTMPFHHVWQKKKIFAGR